MRRLGQHFMKNETVIGKIVAALELSAGDTILEIGPGHGELTLPLAGKCAAHGGRVIAVERDEALAAALATRVKEAGFADRVEIVADDILSFLKTHMRGAAPRPAFNKITGNIPYYLTGHLLREIGELDPRPALAVLMVQKEVAERTAAHPPRMNRLAASVQYWADATTLFSVNKEDFSPAPKVDSAVMRLARKGAPTAEGGDKARAFSLSYYAALRALFAQPRKTLLNNIAAAGGERTGGAASATAAPVTRGEISAGLSKLGLDPSLRPQNLSVDDVAGIGREFFGAPHGE